jgi:phosphate-selective porin OprO/OprP
LSPPEVRRQRRRLGERSQSAGRGTLYVIDAKVAEGRIERTQPISFSADETATDWVGRVTGLPWATPDNRSLLHLGLGFRHVGSDEGMMRFSGRPESNLADKYVDTGSFAADHADKLSLQAVWQRGPVALHAEHVDVLVDAPESGDPHFRGEYATSSRVVTGESRPYLCALSYAGAIVPARPFGAVELVLRFSRVNLTDASIEGGELDRWGAGANWWLSAQ